MKLTSERSPPALPPQQVSWADPPSVSDSEEGKLGSEERRGAERSRRDSEPSAPPKDPKQAELPSSRNSLKGEPGPVFIMESVFFAEVQTVCVHSGALQRHRQVFRQAEQRRPSGKRGGAGEQAR